MGGCRLLARIQIVSTTSDSITVKLVELDQQYSRNDRELWWDVELADDPGAYDVWGDFQYEDPHFLQSGAYETDPYVIHGLRPNTDYLVYAGVYGREGMPDVVTIGPSDRVTTIDEIDIVPENPYARCFGGRFHIGLSGAYDAEYFKIRYRAYNTGTSPQWVEEGPFSFSDIWTSQLTYGRGFFIQVAGSQDNINYSDWVFCYTDDSYIHHVAPPVPYIECETTSSTISVTAYVDLDYCENYGCIRAGIYQGGTIIDQEDIPDYSGLFTFSNLQPGTYVVRATAYLYIGGEYRVKSSGPNGEWEVSRTVNVAEHVRPNNFSWTYTKTSGGSFNLTANEWNSFTSRVNEFRVYSGLSNYSFTQAVSGNNFTAAMYNQARAAIRGISGYGTYIPQVSSGEQITAHMMNVLVSELNAIP